MPVTFSPLALTATLGSPAALGAALLGRYGAEALAQSAALVGSLQLLGNLFPFCLEKSIF